MKIVNPPKINVLMLSAEAFPLVKVGGLGDYAGSLPKAINFEIESPHYEIDLRVILPFHNEIRLQDTVIHKCCDVSVPREGGLAKGSVFETKIDQIHFYLVRRKGKPSGYQSVYNREQKDDARKYIFFSLASLHFLKEIGWKPHIIHANDWHTAAAIKQLISLRERDEFFARMKSVLVVHNLPFLGEGSQAEIKSYGLSKAQSYLLPPWAADLPFPMGLEASDQIVAVSPTYARELLQDKFSHELAPFLLDNQHKISGILNGIDANTWDPENDQLIVKNFSSEKINARIVNKEYIVNKVGLALNLNQPLLVLISRLTHQKGIDLILRGLPKLISRSWSFIILGTGQTEYEKGFKEMVKQYPARCKYFQEYNDSLAHQLYAAGDIFLMPSLYEPCGLSQMIAMRYGCVPVARSVGGLKDSIISDDLNKKDGYLFNGTDTQSFIDSLTQALEDYKDKSIWTAIQSRGMKKDFSWRTSASKYLNLYARLIESF